MTSAFVKHIRMLRAYSNISFKKMSEYKFNLVTNLISVVVVALSWVFFWNLLLGELHEIAHWKFPMLMLLVGFVYLSESMWQILYYSIMFWKDIINGRIDLHLVRPVHPLFAMIMSHMELLAIFPAMFGFGFILFTLFTHFSFVIVNFTIALLISIFAVIVLWLLYLVLGTTCFWFGRINGLRAIFKSFMLIDNYPIDIFSVFVRSFFVFFLPFFFLGTAPVLTLTQWTVVEALKYLSIIVGIAIIWFFIFLFVWKKGVKRYESFGG